MAVSFFALSPRSLLPPSLSSTVFSAQHLRRVDGCPLMPHSCLSWRRKLSLEKSTIFAAHSTSLRGVDSGSENEEESEEEDEVEGSMMASPSPETWDALGLGQAMADSHGKDNHALVTFMAPTFLPLEKQPSFKGMVDDEFLEQLAIEKSTRKVINHEERGRVLRAMDGCSYKAAAGGSLSNTLVALARLGVHSIDGHPPLNIAMAGSVGSDPLGGFYRAKLRRANVNFLSKPVKDGTTGTVIVLTTPDAQRTMLAYQGTSSTIDYDPLLANLVSKTRILIIEGYLLEQPHTINTISKACEEARSHGALIAVTASDISCIERSYEHFWEIINNYADIVFSNSNEARSLCNLTSMDSPLSAARYLSHSVPLVSVTDGPHGSYIGVNGEAVYIPPSPCGPVDTCGAGDAYASGILYGILKGVSDLKGIGMLASRVAAVVVGQRGTRLTVADAGSLLASFVRHLESSDTCSDLESDHISSC